MGCQVIRAGTPSRALVRMAITGTRALVHIMPTLQGVTIVAVAVVADRD
jgi:hypothetical protein